MTWAGIALAAMGGVGTAVALVHGGGFSEVYPRAYVLSLVLAAGVAVAAGSARSQAEPRRAIWWLALLVAVGGGLGLLPLLSGGGEPLQHLVPLMKPAGNDFRVGLYDPAAAFSAAGSGWPPLTLILGRPFTYLGVGTAYALHVVLLVAAAAVTVVLGARLAAGAGPFRGRGRDVTVAQLAIVSALWLFTSYGLLFELERGNVDLYAFLFAVLAVWVLAGGRERVWLCAALLAVAIGLKVYPAALLVPLFWRFGRRAIVPVLVTLAVAFLAAGPANGVAFLRNLRVLEGEGAYLWVGNQSAKSYGSIVATAAGVPAGAVTLVLLVVSIACWALTLAVLLRRGWTASRGVLAAAACVPVMCVVPSVSHDYKLVILVFPFAVLAAAVARRRSGGTAGWALWTVALGTVAALLARSSLLSYAYVVPHAATLSDVVANKYPAILAVQVMLLLLARGQERGWSGADAEREQAGREGGTVVV